MKNLLIVSSSPLVEVTTMIPTLEKNIIIVFILITLDAHHNEGQLLGPHLHVDVKSKPVNEDVKGLGDRVHLAHSVKYNVDSRNEDFPHAVEGEEVSQEVEVFALAALGPVDPLPHVLKVMQLQEEML